MAQQDLVLPDGSYLSSNDSGANAVNTLTLAAGATFGKIRLLSLTASSSVAAATKMTLTLKPDNSTSIAFDCGTAVGVVYDHEYVHPIVGKTATNFVVTLGAAGNTTVTSLAAHYDYKG